MRTHKPFKKSLNLPFTLTPLRSALGRIGESSALALLAVSACSLPAASAELPTDGSLTVNVTGLENTNGQVCFSLFENSEGFPGEGDAVFAQQCISAMVEDASVSVTFPALDMGTYAVSVLHDENEDEQINQGTFGIPIEGFGFSRNPVVQTGAPEFYETAVFVFGETTTDIEMIYF